MFTTTKDSYLTKHNAKGENIHLLIVAFTCLHTDERDHQEKQAQKQPCLQQTVPITWRNIHTKTTRAQYSQKAVMEMYLYAIKPLDQMNREEVHHSSQGICRHRSTF